MKTQLIVTSSSHLPRFRAGVSFLGAKAFPLDHFNVAQLHELLSDRMLTVVVGRVLTAADVESFHAMAVEEAERHPIERLHDDVVAGTTAGTAGTTELVSGLAVYPAGSQAAVLPAPGEAVVNPETAGGTVNETTHVPPVVAHARHGRGSRGS